MSAHFLGRGWKFPVEVDSTTGRIMMSEYEEDIAEAIRIILFTSKGERVMRPKFGCGVREFLFDLTNDTQLRMLESNIREAIRDWEPRVEQVEVQTLLDENDLEKLTVKIQYVVRTTNNLFNQVYPFYINEGAK